MTATPDTLATPIAKTGKVFVDASFLNTVDASGAMDASPTDEKQGLVRRLFAKFSNKKKKEVEGLEKRVHELADLNLALKQTLTKLHNLKGEDNATQMVKLCTDLCTAEETSKHWEDLYYKTEQLLETSKEGYNKTLEHITESVQQYVARKEAEKAEEENEVETDTCVDEKDRQINSLKEQIQVIRHQLLEKEIKHSSLLFEHQEQNALLEEKDAAIDELNKKICNLREDKLELYKVNTSVQQQLHDAERRAKMFATPRSNKSRADNTYTPKSGQTNEPEETDFSDFAKFLFECQKRANRVVQMLKKVGIGIGSGKKRSKLRLEVPTEFMLAELRAVRLIVFKLSDFFDSKKTLLAHENKSLGIELRLEMKSILSAVEQLDQPPAMTKL